MSDDADHRSELLAYATEVAKADDVETVYDAVADAARSVFDFSSSVVLAADGGILSVRSWSGRPPTVDGIPVDEGVAGRTYQTGESKLVKDSLEDPRVDDLPADGPRSVVSVSIGDVGVLQAGLDEPAGFDDDDVDLAELLASHAYQAIERIRSERDVRESEARFRKLFEQADDALVLYDVATTGRTHVRFVNDAAESLFDAPEADLRGDSMSGHIDADASQFGLDDAPARFEARLTDDGDDRVFEVKVKPFLRKDGPDAFAIVSDVTEQHRREHTLTALHDATRRMLVEDDAGAIADVVVEAADDLIGLPYVGVFFAHEDADSTTTDRESDNATTDGNADWQGVLRPATVSEVAGGDQAPVLRAGESLAWEVYESGEPRTYGDVRDQPNVHDPETPIREEIIHPLGDHGVLLVGATEPDRFDSTDHDLVRVLATNAEAALDRAERVRQLRQRESELRRERNRFAALFENVPSPTASFVVEDGVPVVQSVNPAFEDVFGYTEDELAGENLDDHIIPADQESEAELYNRRLAAGENVHAEVRRLTDDGPRDFLLDFVPFQLDEPNMHGYAMYTDITDRKERERELERQNDRLEEFASIVSHDLRNPLNVARGYLELAEQSGDDEYFERMDDALDRMHDIIESVLALARHGRSLDDTEDVALAAAAERAWRNVDTEDATLEVAEDATLEADPSRFGSLLENLFRNAVEHGSTGNQNAPRSDDAVEHGSTSPRSQAHEDAVEHGSTGPGSQTRQDADEVGRADVTVTVGTLDGEDGVEGFYVADDGPGIPPERRDAVFEHGETRNEDGTGFGLAIVNSVAEAHGWTAAIAESDAGGARFEFRT